MSWTTPATWVVGQILTAAQLNTYLKDNTRYLKGLDGVVTTQAGLIIDNTLGTEYFRIPALTTTQRDALTPVEGMIIYNSTLDVFEVYENSTWVARNDIAKMVIASQAQGDIFYAPSATAIARLAAGTAGYWLQTGGVGANPSWVSNLEALRYAAGATALASSDTVTSTLSSSYVKLKEILVGKNGIISTSFDLKGEGTADIAYGRIYINAVAAGTERSTTSASYQTYTENVNVVAGDAVQVYAKVSANISAYIQNFRLTTDYSDTASARVIT